MTPSCKWASSWRTGPLLEGRSPRGGQFGVSAGTAGVVPGVVLLGRGLLAVCGRGAAPAPGF